MPQPTPSAVRRPPMPARWQNWIAPALAVGLSTAWLLAAGACLFVRWQRPSAGPILTLAGLALGACALIQLRFAWLAWRAGRLTLREIPLVKLAHWRSLTTGALLAYLVALPFGHVAYVGCGWLATVCIWQTILLLPLATSGKVLEDWRRWTQARGARRLTWLVYASLSMLAAGELALRINRLAIEESPVAAASSVRLDSFAEVARLKSARLRVALVGDLAGEPSAYLPALERTLGDVEIVRLPRSVTHRDVVAEVLECEPDLVLAVVPVCQELSRRRAAPNYFDWRQFELANLLAGHSNGQDDLRRQPAAGDFESRLGLLAPQLSACRTPLDDGMRDRWNRLYSSLDRLIAGCRDSQVNIALLVVPAEFQVNGALCQTLLRRAGLPAERIDVELPQRRLAGFAESHQVPLIDLLPQLRLCRQSAFRRDALALSEEGNQALAQAVGGWLQSRYGADLVARVRPR